MFHYLPEEIIELIWRKYFSMFVLNEVKNKKSKWLFPTEKLFLITTDYGSIQAGHTDLEKIFKVSPPHYFPLDYILEKGEGENLCEKCIRKFPYYYLPDINFINYECNYCIRDKCFSQRAEKYWDLSFYDNRDYVDYEDFLENRNSD